jgi:adenylate cyclase
MNFFKFDMNRLIGFGIAVATFLVFMLLFTQLSVFEMIERSSLDFRFFLKDPSEKSEKIGDRARRTSINAKARQDIIIIGIDEYTVRDFSDQNIHWPFPWKIHSQFTNYVSSGKPDAIFFDITFLDHKDGERELAESFKKAGNVFIDYPFEVSEVDKKYADLEDRMELLNRQILRESKNGENSNPVDEAVPPTPQLIASAKGVGFANVFADVVDNVIRQMPLLLEYKGALYPNIDLVLVMNHFGITKDDVEIELGKYIKLKNLPAEKMAKPNEEREIVIPIDSKGSMDVNYIGGEGSFRNTSYSYFAKDGSMGGNDSLKDKIVLIAAYSATGISTDVHKSPYGATFGIELHANALNTILNQDFLFTLSVEKNLIIMLIISLFLGFFLPRISILKSAIVAFFAALLFLVVSYLVFDFYNIVNAMLTPAVQIFMTFTFIGTARLLSEQKEKRYIRQTFSKFVSKSVVDDLLKHPEKLKLGGEKKIISVLFSDIRGFTSISEKLTPEALVEHLNEYLQQMTDLVFDTDGTLDKYVGDEIMAFWGAPVELENHALNACRCAIEQMETLAKLNEKWRREGKPELNIGIGINTGDAVVGNMGSSSRMDYTLMGDNVNLGARLEGTNKVYGTNIIISEYTYEHVRDNVIVRELDLIRVKGKERPVKIYELLDILE